MARARNIKPGFFRDAALVELPIEARLLFPGLWTLADRAGRLEDKPKQIKMEIYPADSFDVDDLLRQLSDAGLIVRYEVDGKLFIQVKNFEKHQNPHRDEKPSTIPAPCEHSASTVQPPCKDGGNRADSLIPDSLNLIPESNHAPDKPAQMPQVAGLDVEAWVRWEKYRREIRKPIKPASLLAAQRQLAGYGEFQSQVVEQSIANGYQGLFELKGNGNGKNGSSRADRVSATIAELTGANRHPAPAIDGVAARVD